MTAAQERPSCIRSLYLAPSGEALLDPGSLAPNVDILYWKTDQPLNRLVVFVPSILATSQETG
jgi:hypothetical protein